MSFDHFFNVTAGTGCIDPATGLARHASQLDCSVASLTNYRDNFTGAAFDLPDPQPNKMTAQDLFLVGSLSVSKFRNLSSIGKMLERFHKDELNSVACRTQPTCQTHFHCVLARIPVTTTIYQVALGNAVWVDVDLAWQLIGRLVGVKGNSPAFRTKPLARKRPGLIPILDGPGSIAYLRNQGIPNGRYWSTILTWMQRPAVAPGVAAIRARGAGGGMSDLRIVDVIVWMSMMHPNTRCA